MITKAELDHLHRQVPPNYYDNGIQHNLFQWYWHRRRFALITRCIKKLALPGPVLDVGCHGGDMSSVVAAATTQPVVGCDISEQAIAYAQKRFPHSTFVVSDFPDQSPWPAHSFGAITSFDVMEHIPDTAKTLEEMKRLLLPGGYVIIAVPNEHWLFKIVWFFWTKFRGHVWDGVHVHDFKHEGLALFREKGFTKIVDKKIILRMWWLLIFRLDRP